MDKWNSTQNTFSLDLLNLMGQFSEMLQANSQVVSLTPCESYLDVTSMLFDLNLTHAYPEWPMFPYHGRNTYAYLIAKYGAAFDVVNVQLYESWSHADYQIGVVQVPAKAYLESWFRNVVHGWFVDFANTAFNIPGAYVPGMDIPSQFIKLKPSQTVVGLANGWTSKGAAAGNASKALLIEPNQLEAAYRTLNSTGTSPRGFMYWDIASEGSVPEGEDGPLWMAQSLNSFLNTRPALPAAQA